MKLYVGGFTYNTTEDELKDMFSEFGEVTSATIIMDRQTGNSRGFGFVEMADLKEGQAAIKGLNGEEKNGRKITVSPAREKSSGFGGGPRN
jgi:RNA recognition motif-containing protein